MQRRTFLGSLVGLTAVPSSEAVVNSDSLFDRVKNLPAIPLDTWCNYVKPHLQDDADFWNYRVSVTQVPFYVPSAVMAKAIQTMPDKLPGGWYMHDKEVPPYFTTNHRITRLYDGKWLTVDVLCRKDNLPPELHHLTIYRMEDLLESLSLEGRLKSDQEELTWPQFWGLSGMACDFLPVIKGKCKIKERGMLVTEIDKIHQIKMIASRPYAEPVHAHLWWHGKPGVNYYSRGSGWQHFVGDSYGQHYHKITQTILRQRKT